ncbi:chemotaxis protein CheW [Paenibacillus puerhi]|uniref:chemotaxis protein CheW n=1 Tax=Paenibacillus puerhi TaxID=2692622 RepID=UPI001359E5F6|nr:chemotaxis protein CheW [Paenibacillus puerhi]
MTQAGQGQFIEVGIGDERYAIPIAEVHEIIKTPGLTSIPGAREQLKGVLQVRGQLIPVLCLRARFGYPETAYTKATRIVIVHYDGGRTGIIVDCVHRVTSYGRIQAPPPQLGEADEAFFTGIGQRGEELVCLLKLDSVLQG